MVLPGQVLVLRDPRIGCVGRRIIHDRHRLKLLPIENDLAQLDRAVRQLAEAIIEKLVDRPGNRDRYANTCSEFVWKICGP